MAPPAKVPMVAFTVTATVWTWFNVTGSDATPPSHTTASPIATQTPVQSGGTTVMSAVSLTGGFTPSSAVSVTAYIPGAVQVTVVAATFALPKLQAGLPVAQCTVGV